MMPNLLCGPSFDETRSRQIEVMEQQRAGESMTTDAGSVAGGKD